MGEMKPITVFESTTGAFPIKLERTSKHFFRVTYGKEVKSELPYTKAATELGLAILHCAQLEGKLD